MKRLTSFVVIITLSVLSLKADIIFEGGSTKGNSSGTNGVKFDVNHDGVNELIFDSSGNVGLGVSAPSANLHVAGNLNLSGNITAGINKGLVAWYTFDDGTGTTLTDYSGSGHHGTLTNGPLWLQGKFKEGLSFDGSNDYVDIPSFDIQDKFSTGLTLSAWAKHHNSGSTWSYIIGNSSGSWFHIGKMHLTGQIRFEIHDVDATGELDTTDVNIADGSWHHVVGTWDGRHMKIYYDGVFKVTKVSTQAIPDFGNLRIGARSGPLEYWDGEIDEVRIYNRALTHSEVNELYRSKASYFSQGGTISGNTIFSGNLSTAKLNLPSMTAPSSPTTGDLYSTGSNLLFRNSSGVWVSLVDATDSVWTKASGNLSYEGGNLGVGSLSGAEFTVDNLSSSDNILDLYDNTELVFTVQDGGNIGLGTSSPSYKLDVAGNAVISSDLTLSSDLTMSDNIMPSANNTYHVGSTTYAWRRIYSKDYVVISDRRFKKNIRELGSVDHIIEQLQPVHYHWKNNLRLKDTGLIAQEVLKVLPEAVTVPKQDHEMLGLKYQTLVPVLIQKQKDAYESWKSRSESIRSRFKIKE